MLGNRLHFFAHQASNVLGRCWSTSKCSVCAFYAIKILCENLTNQPFLTKEPELRIEPNFKRSYKFNLLALRHFYTKNVTRYVLLVANGLSVMNCVFELLVVYRTSLLSHFLYIFPFLFYSFCRCTKNVKPFSSLI